MRSRFLQNLVWPGQRCKVYVKSNHSKPLCMFSLQSCQACGEPLFGSVGLCQHFKRSCKEKLNTNPFPASSLKTSVPACSRLDHVYVPSKLWLQKFVLKFLYSVPLTVFTIASQCQKKFDIKACTVKKESHHHCQTQADFPKIHKVLQKQHKSLFALFLTAVFLSYTFNLVQLHHSPLLCWTVGTPASTAGEQHLKKLRLPL